ncbi:sensor histidine kinase [Marisediminicola senii]|uniref:sensor histidine kinase n=1 Tax=Marisediminicola senii TaxID=2711233 RepID=UPI0013ED295D|nr:GAF domain-containing protein [Marisediminicola senii]
MNTPHSLAFPDGPRTDLDAALSALMSSAQKVADTQGRLRELLKANRLVVGQLDLPTVLTSLIGAAVGLVDARYGALGVRSADGGLEQFVHVGMTEEQVARIGRLPEGHGMLGAVLTDGAPVRTAHIHDDPRSVGFPAAHPAMESFLGVPIRVRGELFGSLYFAEKRTGEFTAEDQELLTSLAATAGIAIDNARMFDETARRQAWSAASTEVATSLLSDDAESPLHLIADRVVTLADADLACIVLPATATTVIVDTARGRLAGDLQGLVVPADGTLSGRALQSHEILVTANLQTLTEVSGVPLQLGPTIAVPLETPDTVHGALTVSRSPGRAGFSAADIEMITDFARQATLAIDVAAVRSDRHRLERAEDRGRIARDLHDHVIQRLYAAGLDMQASARSDVGDDTRARLERHIDMLDAAIVEIRTAIFALAPQTRAGRTTLKFRVIDLLAELGDVFTVTPRLAFAGPLDLLGSDGAADDLIDDVLAVVREGLSNVARHADATAVAVRVSAAEGRVEVQIVDDGVGMPHERNESGLANLAVRAARWRGSLRVEPGDGDGTGAESGTSTSTGIGTRLRWSAEIPTSPGPALHRGGTE